MSTTDDIADHLRMMFRDPSEDEEGPVRPVLRHEIEQESHSDFQPTRSLLPRAARNERSQGRDLKVFFDVDGEVVSNGAACHAMMCLGRWDRRPTSDCRRFADVTARLAAPE